MIPTGHTYLHTLLIDTRFRFPSPAYSHRPVHSRMHACTRSPAAHTPGCSLVRPPAAHPHAGYPHASIRLHARKIHANIRARPQPGHIDRITEHHDYIFLPVLAPRPCSRSRRRAVGSLALYKPPSRDRPCQAAPTGPLLGLGCALGRRPVASRLRVCPATLLPRTHPHPALGS